MKTYHNEIDRACCLVLANHFLDSFIDSRSIEDVKASDLEEYQQCHFFAGIGGFSEGFRRAGVPTNFNVWTGGFPCQDLSVAGKRKGLAGKRSGLYFEFHRLITSCYPRWVVLENVPGLLSSNDGRDFAIVIGGLTGIIPDVPKDGWGNAGFFRGPVYSVAYRVLDAQFFGVAQRRHRVFIVASLGTGRAAEVLFERESLPGDTPPSREKGEGVARYPEISPALSSEGSDSSEDGNNRHALICAHETGKGFWSEGLPGLRSQPGGMPENMVFGFSPRTTRIGEGENISPTMCAGGGGFGSPAIAFGGNNTSGEIDVATACNAHGGTGRMDFESETFVTAFNIQHNDGGEHKRKDRPNGGLYVNETDTALTVGTTDLTAIAFSAGNSGDSYGIGASENVTPPIRAGNSGTNQAPTAAGGFGVRRLTPVECERLQGFPDNWTNEPPQSDSSRYRQLGNAVCVNVIHWLGQRIMEVENVT